MSAVAVVKVTAMLFGVIVVIVRGWNVSLRTCEWRCERLERFVANVRMAVLNLLGLL